MKSNRHHSSSYEHILMFEATQQPLNHIIYFDENNNRISLTDSIKNVSPEGDVKYLALESGSKIQLEQIYSVDGDISPYYSNDYFACDCV
ncbi:hypothetical protein V6R21_25840 [Limibacter armeniacum]|uniref:hypothetical protein n=1 Tax=Limibacter armeniacum TaxID=466084 RepID=UPI002FE60140